MSEICIAHVRESDKKEQSIKDHLFGVANLGKKNAEKLGFGLFGELLGLLHDLGKYSNEFQAYIKSGTGLIDQDADEYVDAGLLRGKIDHSSAGAQLVWKKLLTQKSSENTVVAQIITLCLISHHSGLVDCISPDGEDLFSRRMEKADEKTHLRQVVKNSEDEIIQRIEQIISNPMLVESAKRALDLIVKKEKKSFLEIINDNAGTDSNAESRVRLKIGLLLRVLFSCLIDADRADTTDFENPRSAEMRQKGNYIRWEVLAGRLEKHLASFKIETPIDQKRADISNACLQASRRGKGLFTLTVPTGGGKTLASLRFALHHALNCGTTPGHSIDRVVYVIPYTSIIDQNADVARKILEPPELIDDQGLVILEHHSNLTDDKETWRGKILSENWDAPVVFTTNVQFLETLFGAGTRGARRMHQLANSVIIFDEIQTLPIRCIHLFCNAINFLVDHCGCTVVLCTATQPLLDQVDKSKGALSFSHENKIIQDESILFKDLKRVEIVYKQKTGGWEDEEIATLAMEELQLTGSCLVIVNTTKSARNIYRIAVDGKKEPDHVFHLSANMCPAHRMKILKEIRQRLDSEHRRPVLCISTQVIEAGVDVDFGSVIRFMAGLDSIAQAAGRCNRHGHNEKGRVFIVNPANENLDKLVDIRMGKEATERVLSEFKSHPYLYGPDLLDPQTIRKYFEYYFFARKNEMEYPVKPGAAQGLNRDDSLLEIFSTNQKAVCEYTRRNKQKPPNIYLRQSFKTASEAFKSIDSPTRGVVVPYGDEGEQVIAELCSEGVLEKGARLLRKAQLFSVNVYPHLIKKLLKEGALFEAQPKTGILCLDKRFYSKEFGLSEDLITLLELILVERRD